MFQRKTSRFRHRSNGRGHRQRGGGPGQIRLRSKPFSNGQPRNNFRPFLSAEKLFEKYSTLAKEAMSSGDNTLSENYLQHADHFMRIIEDKNRNQNLTKLDTADKSVEENKHTSENSQINQVNVIKNKD